VLNNEKILIDTILHSDTLRPYIIDADINFEVIKSYFIQQTLGVYNSSPLIDSISFHKIININEKNIELYTVNLPAGFPNNISNNYIVCILSKKFLYIIPIVHIIDLSLENNCFKIMGLREVREFEFLVVYSLSDKLAFKEFDTSSKPNSNGIFVSYFKDDECIDFSSDRSIIEVSVNNEIFISNHIYLTCSGNKEKLDLNLLLSKQRNELSRWTLVDLNGNANLIYNLKN